MTRVNRVDIGTLAAPVKRADGTIVVDARLSRSGIYTYRKADGSETREYRPEQNVSDPHSLASFVGRPVTNDHPPGMLDASNAKLFAVGAVLDSPHFDGQYVQAKISIYDAATIAQMEAGKRQVSCGYECDLDETPGVTPDGHRYDAIQTNIVGNHVAIVQDGRAGAGASVRMDASYMIVGNEIKELATQPVVACNSDTNKLGFSSMSTSKIDANEALVALEAQRLDAVNNLEIARKDASDQKTRADVAEGKVIELQKALDEATAKNAAASKAFETEVLAKETARADSAERLVADFNSKFAAAVSARVSLERRAVVVMGSDFRMDDMTDRQIMAAVVTKLDHTADVSDKVEDGIINGRFLTITDRHASTARELAAIAQANVSAQRADAKSAAAKKPSWMEPLPTNALKNVSK